MELGTLQVLVIFLLRTPLLLWIISKENNFDTFLNPTGIIHSKINVIYIFEKTKLNNFTVTVNYWYLVIIIPCLQILKNEIYLDCVGLVDLCETFKVINLLGHHNMFMFWVMWHVCFCCSFHQYVYDWNFQHHILYWWLCDVSSHTNIIVPLFLSYTRINGANNFICIS